MKIIINNIITIVVYSILGIITMIIFTLIVFVQNKQSLIYPIISNVYPVSLFVIFFNLWVHFLSGRYFLRSVNNFFLNITSFILIIFFVIIDLFYPVKNTLTYFLPILHSPSYFIGIIIKCTRPYPVNVLNLCVFVFLSILMQFLGLIRSKHVLKNRKT